MDIGTETRRELIGILAQIVANGAVEIKARRVLRECEMNGVELQVALLETAHVETPVHPVQRVRREFETRFLIVDSLEKKKAAEGVFTPCRKMELHHGESATQHLLVDFLLLELAHEHFGEAGEIGHQMVDRRW